MSGVKLDLSQLSAETLRTYAVKYRLGVKSHTTTSELATEVSNHFNMIEDVDEEVVISRFLQCLESPQPEDGPASTMGQEMDETGDDGEQDEFDDRDDELVAQPGEQVAAKVSLVDENGSWILASVVAYNPRTSTYHVQDEDDPSKILELAAARIRRLVDESSPIPHDFQKGDRVLAIFPETTSFYRAVISKTPKRSTSGQIYEVVLKFEDDEDDSGRTPHRRVSLRYVLREDVSPLRGGSAGPDNGGRSRTSAYGGSSRASFQVLNQPNAPGIAHIQGNSQLKTVSGQPSSAHSQAVD